MDFIDLSSTRRRLEAELAARTEAVHRHGQYVLGPEVLELETSLCEFTGAAYCVTCGSGTDAVALSLRALGVGPGHAVFLPSFTYVATASAVLSVGATPVLVDVTDDFLLDPESLARAFAEVKAGRRRGAGSEALTPRVVIPVGLFGLPVAEEPLASVASSLGLEIVEDAAQCFGASRGGRVSPATFALGATSFYPSKPLGCFGDGGAVFTDSLEQLLLLRSLRAHGRGEQRGVAVRPGLNSRLDTLQAAVLLSRLSIFDDELRERRRVAERYLEGLDFLTGRGLRPPSVPSDARSSWAAFVVRVPSRDAVQAALAAEGIPTLIHYPVPLHRQPAFASLGYAPGALPVSERLAEQVLSLPMHPYLTGGEQAQIVEALEKALARR
jgi:dTDP-4-amino-4,6-dideoxygalactose transaminase